MIYEMIMRYQLAKARQTAKPPQAEEIFSTILPSLKSQGVYLTQDLVDGLLSVFGNSNFLARWARRFPEKVSEVLATPLHFWTEQNFHREWLSRQNSHNPRDGESLVSLLLDFKYRHYFRITLRDLGLNKPFQEIASEISDLAKTILKGALHWQMNALGQELGMPIRDSSPRDPIPFSILGMGKLGGQELNYSSDLDLIYFYGSDQGKIIKGSQHTSLSPHEFFTKLSERMTRFLNQKTSEGFLYRIDLELRPEGKSGPLANSIDAMEDYYESFGASWEKQAMIKASPAAGSHELCGEFFKRIRPFVYPKIADFSFLLELKEMKEKLLASVQTSSQQGFHVKLGKGGIREIEFFIQSLQMLFGGKISSLQCSNTLEATEKIYEAGLISESEKNKLEKAYIFLRTLENRLQLVEEQQTHLLHDEEEALLSVARRMGYGQCDPQQATESLRENLRKHRDFVENLFEQLLAKRFEG